MLVNTLIQKFGYQVRARDIIRTSRELNLDCRWILKQREKLLCGRGTYDLNKITETTRQQTEIIEMTDEEINLKLKARFEALHTMSKAAANGNTRSFIISGPAGLGKTFEVMKAIREAKPNFNESNDKITGFSRATGLYKSLYEHRSEGDILVFDDADSIFFDDVALNILKAACDTTKNRYISWRAETKMQDEFGDVLPNCFEFKGTIVFITNYDFNELIAKDNKLSPHFDALMSRSHYLDLEIKTKREYLMRIKHVMQHGIANLDEQGKTEIYSYLEENKDVIKDLSLRKVIKLAQIRAIGGDWKALAAQLN